MVVQGKGEGGRGGRRETGTTRIERELERSSKQARYPGDDWRRDKRLTTIAEGAVSRGHRKNQEGNRAFRGRHATRAKPGDKTRPRDSRPLRGAPSPKPLHQHPSQVPPAAQVRGGHAYNHRDTGKDNRSSMAPAVSQFGRTAGKNRRSWGGRQLNKTTDREEARGGERDACAGKVVVDMELGRGNLGKGDKGGYQRHQGYISHNPK